VIMTQSVTDVPVFVVNIYALSVFAISVLLYLPTVAYGIFKLYRFRKHIIIKKRYPEITQIICFQIIVVITAEGIRAASQAVCTQWRWWTFHPVVALISSIALWFLLRTYLNYFAIKHSNAILGEHWKHIISPDAAETDWFIANRPRFGSYSFWRPFGVAAIFLNLSICYSVELTSMSRETADSFLNGFALTINGFVLGVITIVRIKTPRFNDIFHHRDELRRVIVAGVPAIAIKICTFNAHRFIAAKYPQLVHLDEFVFISESLLFSSLALFVAHTLTLWVIDRNEKWLTNPLEDVESPVSMADSERPTMGQYGSNNIELYAKAVVSLDRSFTDVAVHEAISVNEVLAMDKGFEALLFHFAQEFSTEIILCLMEITQFQQVVHRYYAQQYPAGHRRGCGRQSELTQQYWLTAPKSVPRSSIVFGSITPRVSATATSSALSIADHGQLRVLELEVPSSTMSSGDELATEYEPEMTKCDEFMQRAQAIYDKYIANGSEFEVNLSWNIRKKMEGKLQALALGGGGAAGNAPDAVAAEEEEDRLIAIYQLFNPTMDALHLLLRSTFGRFTASALFEQLCK